MVLLVFLIGRLEYQSYDFFSSIGRTAHNELMLYLNLLVWRTASVTGKVGVDEIMVDRMHHGDKFNLKQVMNQILKCGLVPALLLHWEILEKDGNLKTA